jgi:hypothetical protein
MKIVYEINDRKGLINLCKQQSMKDSEIERLLSDGKDFHVIYTLEGNKNSGTLNYTLIDAITKEKLNIHSLNGYEKGYINECFDHFRTEKDKILKNEFISILELVKCF